MPEIEILLNAIFLICIVDGFVWQLALPKILYLYEKFCEMIDYKQIITIEPGKRGGKPCIRGMRITVNDIIGWLASGMTIQDILTDFDELTDKDIYAALSFAAVRENKIYQLTV